MTFDKQCDIVNCQGDDYVKKKSKRELDSKEDLIQALQSYVDKYGRPKSADFNSANNLRNVNYYKKVLGVDSLKEVLELVGIKTSDQYDTMHYSPYKNMTNEELLQTMRDYNDNVKLPTTRAFTRKNGLPSGRMYIDRFGSFKRAILEAGIDIPRDKQWFFERESLDDEEIAKQIEIFTKSFMAVNNRLPTYQEIDNNKQIPSTSIILKRFESLEKLYEKIGVDIDYNNKTYKQELLKEYLTLTEKYDRVLTSRDLDKLSLRGESASASTYARHFGSIHNIQCESQYQPTWRFKDKTKEDLISDMQNVGLLKKRVPIQSDFDTSQDLAPASMYVSQFGSFYNALLESGFIKDEIYFKRFVTEGGVHCLSTYEYQFANMLEEKKIPFQSEPMYKKYVQNLEELYRFDYEIGVEGKIYLVEIFGITGRQDYTNRAEKKIAICKSNDIPLISFYPQDFINKDIELVYGKLMKLVSSTISNIEYNKEDNFE